MESMTDKEIVDQIDSRRVWIAQPKERVTNPDKPWEVIREDGEKAIKNFATREAAWSRAKELAKKNSSQNRRAGARVKNMSDGQFSKNNFYPSPQADPYYGGGEEEREEDMYESSRDIVTVVVAQGKPVKASEYYDSRFSSGLGDAYQRASRLDKSLYDIGRATSRGISHSADIKSAQATGDTVTFVYASNRNLSEEKLEEVSNILGISGTDIYLYRSVEGRDKPYINALKTTPEQSVDAGVVTTMFDRKDIRHEKPVDGNVMAYIPVEMLE